MGNSLLDAKITVFPRGSLIFARYPNHMGPLLSAALLQDNSCVDFTYRCRAIVNGVLATIDLDPLGARQAFAVLDLIPGKRVELTVVRRTSWQTVPAGNGSGSTS
jgi:hypothetical protein